MIKYSVIITTINIPYVLEQLADNLKQYDTKNYVEVLIIGDKKTPENIVDYVNKFRNNGFNFEYWNISDQEEWLIKYPEVKKMIPYNSDNRRNVGFLIAYSRNREILVIMDDDNFPLKHFSYFDKFSHIGIETDYNLISTESGWLNIANRIKKNNDLLIYPRGFPFKYRSFQEEKESIVKRKARMVVQAGLWNGDPDIDAITRLVYPVVTEADDVENFALDIGINCPFNTQNTAVHRDIIPAYYYFLMNQNINGNIIDRYGDIWESYFAKKVIDSAGDIIGFGQPVVFQKRNEHNLFKDLQQELPGMMLTDKFVDMLSQIKLRSNNYFELSEELAEEIVKKVTNDNNFTEDEKSYFCKISENVRHWVQACRSINQGIEQ